MSVYFSLNLVSNKKEITCNFQLKISIKNLKKKKFKKSVSSILGSLNFNNS